MKQYLDQLQTILATGVEKEDRTGVGTISCFGMQARYDMAAGFPAVTTKRLAWKLVVSELLWFISGSSNLNDLKAIYRNNGIWDANHEDFVARGGDPEGRGEMGRIYGVQWRSWNAGTHTVDQLQDAIALIRSNPDSRRIIVNAWNPAESDPAEVALPPCHTFFQFYVAAGRLSLQMYQRSADMFLGVPFNIASYSLLLHMVARLTGLEPGEFIHTIGDAHIYLDAIEQCREQLARDPLPLPQLAMAERGQLGIDDFLLDDFQLVDYQCHAPIKATMAV